MPRVEETIALEQPPEKVFEFVTTPENDHLWSSTAVERRREAQGPIGVGSRIHAVDKFLGRRVESVFVITEHEPHTRSSIRLQGSVEGRGSYILEPLDGRTLFRWVLEVDPGFGGLYLGRVTDPLVTMIFRRRLRFDLRRLKEVLEQTP